MFRSRSVIAFVAFILAVVACKDTTPTPRQTLLPSIPVTIWQPTQPVAPAPSVSVLITHTAMLPIVTQYGATSLPSQTKQQTSETTPSPIPSLLPATQLQLSSSTPIPLPTLTPRPPGVEITSPSSPNPIRAHTPLYIAVNAMSPSGLQKIELYVNDQVIASRDAKGAKESNLVAPWQTDINGDYRVQAKAIDQYR